MMYKDKDKQREANRTASQRRRDMLKGMTNQGVTVSGSDTRVIPKRGKDIKCFEDLPDDVQETINQMCRIDDNKRDATAKANRTAIAIHYQHVFPDRYTNPGWSLKETG